jgi:L-methionine (R)-S-oxide reductase
MYESLYTECHSIVDGERNFITNASNICAIIFDKMPNLNWVGFYMMNNEELLLGPFQGKVACTRIALGKGVCGATITKRETIVVENVHEFPGHIACDSASNSEIVVPLIKDDKIYGVFDIDSPLLNRFSDNEKIFFEKIAELILSSCDMDRIYNYYNS